MSDNNSQKVRAIKAYKELLREAIGRCPAGTQRRIAEQTGTSKSFVSQILNAHYPVPLPQKYVDSVIEICNLSDSEKDVFREAYLLAHPPRRTHENRHEMRISLPDFKNAVDRRRAEDAIKSSARTILQLLEDK